MLKQLLSRQPVQRLLCRLIAAYIRLVQHTSQFTTLHAEYTTRYWNAGEPFILAFWHGRLLLAPLAWRGEATMRMLISQHRDGRLIAGAIGHFGLGTIAGSRSKGGALALRGMIKALADGQNVGVTPDGPDGPWMRASAGIVAAARLSGAPILPLTYATTRRRILGTWDRFHLALPFSRGCFIWGEPMAVAASADAEAIEQARQQLENSLNAITAEADSLCGHTPIDPAPLAGRPLGRRRRKHR
jgi:lysophospholipid acyltransferase (LPLAT)-like uncharacterized protein